MKQPTSLHIWKLTLLQTFYSGYVHKNDLVLYDFLNNFCNKFDPTKYRDFQKYVVAILHKYYLPTLERNL
jgi:hypothetical protein